jgi:hypothetical protein
MYIAVAHLLANLRHDLASGERRYAPELTADRFQTLHR